MLEVIQLNDQAVAFSVESSMITELTKFLVVIRKISVSPEKVSVDTGNESLVLNRIHVFQEH